MHNFCPVVWVAIKVKLFECSGFFSQVLCIVTKKLAEAVDHLEVGPLEDLAVGIGLNTRTYLAQTCLFVG